jgi:hypothetical protein
MRLGVKKRAIPVRATARSSMLIVTAWHKTYRGDPNGSAAEQVTGVTSPVCQTHRLGVGPARHPAFGLGEAAHDSMLTDVYRCIASGRKYRGHSALH